MFKKRRKLPDDCQTSRWEIQVLKQYEQNEHFFLILLQKQTGRQPYKNNGTCSDQYHMDRLRVTINFERNQSLNNPIVVSPTNTLAQVNRLTL